MPRQQSISGQPLIADFQTVFVSSATIEAARHEAMRSEDVLINQLENISSGSYLNPDLIAANAQDKVSRASLDAHIKKVQAEQLQSMNLTQLRALIDQNNHLYSGKKVRVTVLLPHTNPFETVWFDQQNGYRTSISKKRTITGIIDEVLLEKNALILHPTMGMRLLNGRLQNYIVYIIDPASLMPMVTIDIL